MDNRRRKSRRLTAKKEDEGETNSPHQQQQGKRQLRDSLQAEMELIGYGRSKNGHPRRQLGREQSIDRRRKHRKLEEKEDKLGEDEEVNAPFRKSVPVGSTVAEEDNRVIEESLVFRPEALEADDDDDENDGESLHGDDDEEEELEEEAEEAGQAETAKKPKARFKKPNVAAKKKRRKKQRLKSFRSFKMAEKHGEAMAAHIRGQPRIAIKKLQQLAIHAPSAPQIYSSLGLVYEGMLNECRLQAKNTVTVQSETNESVIKDNFTGSPEEKFFDEQLRLARKVYGNHHIAAILCKKDPTLWQRSGDAAAEVAEVHSSVMESPLALGSTVNFHRSEKRRWLEEARNDYQGAVELQPLGISAHAKLGCTLIELGHLSEALKLLTDLKTNRHFESSYRAWLLYADLMLRVGHECSRWSQGIETNDNYMFRRWLRKHCNAFDWKERRLQALAKALEAACGSENCRKLISWLVERAAQTTQVDEENEDFQPTSNESDIDEANDRKRQASGSGESSATEDNDLMDRNHRAELAAFDRTTEEMALPPNSVELEMRKSARTKLIDRHATTATESANGSTKESPQSVEKEGVAKKLQTPLLISASSRIVCEIGVKLIRHMLDRNLHEGGVLVGECISCYMKERASRIDGQQSAVMVVDALPQTTRAYAMQERSYDSALVPDGDYDEANDVPNLSDDEELENSTDALESFRQGILPPNIVFLNGLCLAHAGNKAFLAAQCIKAVRNLPMENDNWLEEKVRDTSLDPHNCWLSVERTENDGLTRTVGLAMVRRDIFDHLMAHLFDEACRRTRQTGGQYALDKSTGGIVLYARSTYEWSRLCATSLVAVHRGPSPSVEAQPHNTSVDCPHERDNEAVANHKGGGQRS